MGWLILLIVITALTLALIVFISPHLVSSKGSDVSKQKYSYQIRGTLLTPSEIKFYHALKQAVGDKFIIFGKVRVADVLTPENGLSKSHWQRAFNKISAKHFDFVLCNLEDLTVEAVIELDDKSHQKSGRIDRDNFLNQAAQSSELKMLRFAVKSSYSISEIKSKIL
ncbi:MAG: DUF2726 domain-containing protein [Microcystis aeruginosa Ma_MB_F_20061100_S20]|uniref:DUF2726 domain-containing protein n=1 Tax=Microcystis aeruginosa Ma_MB_F_20061100_S20D TaxID=2486253 RepID=A0A552EAA7_MICAE|nr:MAG: DUF2726 domain-containing protein [Microcystis aeruginosa Ma_MB_F_20061100_S20D]TRU42897.1 MAG: DUF2726 domain-containing protein [Microcystis aeruginosa Ma_MB_F_20061100_S20]